MTNYERLLGTPERAAHIAYIICDKCGHKGLCYGCPIADVTDVGLFEENECLAYLREEADDALHSQSD